MPTRESKSCSRIHRPWLGGIKSTPALGCPTCSPGFMGWWVGKTTLCPQSIYKEYHSVSLPLLELGLSHSLSRQRVCPSHRNHRVAGHTRVRVRGWGSPNSNDWRKSLALCLLCAYVGVNSIPKSGIYEFGYCSTVLNSQTFFKMFEFGGFLLFLLRLAGRYSTKVRYPVRFFSFFTNISLFFSMQETCLPNFNLKIATSLQQIRSGSVRKKCGSESVPNISYPDYCFNHMLLFHQEPRKGIGEIKRTNWLSCEGGRCVPYCYYTWTKFTEHSIFSITLHGKLPFWFITKKFNNFFTNDINALFDQCRSGESWCIKTPTRIWLIDKNF